MSSDPLKAMSAAELLRGLRKVGEPFLLELAIRGYKVELDQTDAKFGVVRFTTIPDIDSTYDGCTPDPQ